MRLRGFITTIRETRETVASIPELVNPSYREVLGMIRGRTRFDDLSEAKENIDGLIENPTYDQLYGLIRRSKQRVVRGLYFEPDNVAAFWDAYSSTHGKAERILRSQFGYAKADSQIAAALDPKVLDDQTLGINMGSAMVRVGNIFLEDPDLLQSKWFANIRRGRKVLIRPWAATRMGRWKEWTPEGERKLFV